MDPLPAGWFYNGTQFVSFDGEKQDLHPSKLELLRQTVTVRNTCLYTGTVYFVKYNFKME